jgi:hypothetical protein
MDDNIKIDLKETGSVCVDWGQPIQYMEQCLVYEESNQNSGAKKQMRTVKFSSVASPE